MRNIVIILFSLSTCFIVNVVNAQCRKINSVYWEQINDSIKKETIASKEMNADVVNYYNKNFNISDDEKLPLLLKILTSEPKNRNIKALYFYLFNKICMKADGATADGLGNYCQKVIINDPVYALSYFSSHNLIMKTYAHLLGYEFYFKEIKMSSLQYDFNDFKKLINDKIANSINLQKTFNDFSSEIEKIMKNMD